MVFLILFFVDAKWTRVPTYTESNLFALNNIYWTDYETPEQAKAEAPSHFLNRMFEFQSHYVGIQWLAPFLASLFLAPGFSKHSAQMAVSRGCSRGRYFTVVLLRFYVLLAMLLLLHLFAQLLSIGLTAFALVDWSQLLRMYVLQTFYYFGFISITVVAAFLTQSQLLTVLVNFGIYALLMTGLHRLTPLYYVLNASWIPPYDNAFAQQGMAVSLGYLVVCSLLAYLALRLRDLRNA